MVIARQKIARMLYVNFDVLSLITVSAQRLGLLSRSKWVVAAYLLRKTLFKNFVNATRQTGLLLMKKEVICIFFFFIQFMFLIQKLFFTVMLNNMKKMNNNKITDSVSRQTK